MSIDTFIRVTIDAGASSITDRKSHLHQVARATSNGGDITVAFDKTKVSKLNTLRSALDQIVVALQGGSELTA